MCLTKITLCIDRPVYVDMNKYMMMTINNKQESNPVGITESARSGREIESCQGVRGCHIATILRVGFLQFHFREIRRPSVLRHAQVC